MLPKTNRHGELYPIMCAKSSQQLLPAHAKFVPYPFLQGGRGHADAAAHGCERFSLFVTVSILDHLRESDVGFVN